jgi:hypothetical protein
VIEILVRILSSLWAAAKARAMQKAAADLPRGAEINKEIAADVAELETLNAQDSKP